jgi:hypothetical protein
VLQPAQIEKESSEIRWLVTNAVVRDDKSYRDAASISKAITKLRKEADSYFTPIIQKVRAAYEESLAQRRRAVVPLEEDQRTIDGKILRYQSEQEELRRRQEAELMAQKKREAEDQAIKEAEELQRQGEADLADAVLAQAAEAPPPVVALPKTTPKIEGLAKRVVWRFRIVKPELVPREYLRVDEVKIGGVVRALKNATRIAGVEVYAEDTAVHR